MHKSCDALITAAEAWPAFERAVLQARAEVVAGFRIFDMRTPLISEEARAIGETWFDLFAHVLDRGVRIDLKVSDFDPVMATDLHEMAWTTVRQGAALSEISGAGSDRLRVRAVLHPAKAGGLPWLAFLPLVWGRKRRKQAAMRAERLTRQAIGLNSSDLPRLHPVSHHQKLAVIDGETLYVGGLDLNARRFDTPEHVRPASETWSDVQLILRGPAARQARAHLASLEEVTAGRMPPAPAPLLKRTLSAPRRFQFPFVSPRTLLREIEEAHIAAFDRARHLVHIETQYLRSGPIARALARAARRNPELRAIVILPAIPDDVAFEDARGLDARYGIALQRRAVKRIGEAFGQRIVFASPVRPVLAARDAVSVHRGSPVIHVHNKVLLCDTDYALVGSANLNGRSMRWDTEVAVEVTDPAQLGPLRSKVLSHWWGDLPAAVDDARETFDTWQQEIRRNGVRRPENRNGFLVPYDPENGAELAQNLPGATEDIV